MRVYELNEMEWNKAKIVVLDDFLVFSWLLFLFIKNVGVAQRNDEILEIDLTQRLRLIRRRKRYVEFFEMFHSSAVICLDGY